MEIEDFRKEFLETVRSTAAVEEEFSRAAFVQEAAVRLTDAGELSDFEHCYYEGTGVRRRKIRVDGFGVDEADGSFRLVIADFRGGDTTETLIQTQAEGLFSQIQAFIEDALSERLTQSIEESTPGYGLASLIHQHRSSITRFRLYLLSDALLSSRVRDLPSGDLSGTPVEYHIWDIGRFHRAFESTIGLDELEVDFSEFVPEGLPCIDAGQTGDKYFAYLCVIPGDVLAKIYDRYGSRLLEGNVRSFLTVRGKVNKGIQVTIKTKPEMFFAYNNGIATTATDVEVANTRAGMRLKRASYLQIVNGGQTTASLALAKQKDSADLSTISVPMKLSIVKSSDPDSMNDMIQSISRYANSQNKVSDADFFANHPFHRRLEERSRRVWAPTTGGAQHETHWFYERARGQYLNEQAKLNITGRKKFQSQNPRNQVIIKTDLAKFENTWGQLPHVVSMGAQKNFLKFAEHIGARWSKDDTEFNEGYFRDVVAKAVIFKHTEKVVSAQSWYQGGYRANIVAYTISKLSHMIEKSGRSKVMDFRPVWDKQGVSGALDAQLSAIAREVFEVIVAPEGGFQNVTEWCKKELCWQRVQALDIPILADFRRELVDKDEARSNAVDEAQKQEMDSGIDAQTKVLALGSDYWRRLYEWAPRNAPLTAAEASVVNVAMRIPNRLPSAKQSEWLLRIKNRLEGEGFR